MINEEFIANIVDYCNYNEIKKYKLWVYEESEIIQVFHTPLQNTKQITFSFYAFSHLYWKMMQNQCINEINGKYFYDFYKLKIFILNYLLFDTNIPNVVIDRNEDGTLTSNSLNSVLSIHPRILRALFEIVDLFPQNLSNKEEKQLEKQCYNLFCKGQSVSNPHPWITTYCNIISFWEKFGMNYHDIMKLPNNLFILLKKIMMLDNENKSKNIEGKNINSKGVGF